MRQRIERTDEKMGVVFIHGAGLHGRIWDAVAEVLDMPCLQLDMPLRGGDAGSRRALTFADYTAYMKERIEAWEIPRFVIVAHSIGGVPAMRLAAELPERVAGFVAVGAAIPERGGSFLSTLPLPKRIVLSAVLRMLGTKPPASAIRAGLCSDLTAAQADAIVREFAPESVRLYVDRADAPVPDVPKLYVKLTEDKEFDEALQNNMIANLAPRAVSSLATGHLPMLSDPHGLGRQLAEFLGGIAARETALSP